MHAQIESKESQDQTKEIDSEWHAKPEIKKQQSGTDSSNIRYPCSF